MITQEAPTLEEKEVARRIYHQMSEDDAIRELREAREDFSRCERTTQRLIERQKKAIQEMNAKIAANEAKLADNEAKLAEQQRLIIEIEEFAKAKGIDLSEMM